MERQIQINNYTGVKVFSATKAKERDEMGNTITRWLQQNTQYRIAHKVVTQSSDKEFHCLTVTLFYADR